MESPGFTGEQVLKIQVLTIQDNLFRILPTSQPDPYKTEEKLKTEF
jgi:hypothetical protein